VGDLDGDGKPELAIAGVFGVHVLRNVSPGPGSDANPFAMAITQPGAAQGIAIGDVDGDGKPDVVAAQDGGFNVFLNAGAGGSLAIGPAQSFVFGNLWGPNMGIAVTDLDRDGRPDIAWAMGEEYQGSVVRNVSTPGILSFADYQILPSSGAGAFNTMQAGDLDRDGVPDLWTTGEMGGTFLLNRSTPGQLVFDAMPSPPLDTFTALADVDRDGRLVSAVTQSVPPRVEMKALKMYHPRR
jgi:hypothetical protein